MHLSQQDLFTGLIAIAAIAVALLCIELSVKNKLLNKLIGRKLLHFTAICTCAFSIYRFENRILLACTFLLFFFILLWVIRKGWMQVNEYKTYGIALFPLAFALLLFIPAFSIVVIVYAVLILGISDAIAGIYGEYFGKQKIIFLAEKKSWAGFTAFYISAFVFSLCYFSNSIFSVNKILFCAILALLPALTELFSYKGSDNFTVPIFSAVWLLLINHIEKINLQIFFVFIVVFILLSLFAVYKKWLIISGATAALWMALLLFGTGELKAFIAPGIFLISGSLLSKLNKPQKEKEGRNAKQVFANGIIGIVFMIFYGVTKHDIYLITAIVSFCISMADSTSSELGVYFKGATYDILSFKRMQPGVSGGISWQGTLAGLAGALLLSFAASYFYIFSFQIFFGISFAGFAGMITDSILGSWLQVKYKTADGKLTDDEENGAIKIKGVNWCTNDMVNILSNILITLLFFYIYGL